MHHSYLDHMRASGEVEEVRLAYSEDGPTEYFMDGRLVCRNGLFVDVQKTLELDASGQTRTRKYSYHAGVMGLRDRPIFRYDNAHVYAIEGHPDAHHRHRFDHATWQEIQPPEWVGYDRWPHLDEIVKELMAWWVNVGRRLDLGD